MRARYNTGVNNMGEQKTEHGGSGLALLSVTHTDMEVGLVIGV